MPLAQYRALKKAVELVQIERREVYVYDTAHAFSDPQKAFKALKELRSQLNISDQQGGISWESDTDAVDRVKKMMR